jgi:hypothetical protein
MRIETYTLTHNEELRMPWYLEHYAFADAHYVYDNGSSDKTAGIAQASPKTTVVQYESDGLDDNKLRDIKNSCWKSSQADWVIVGDVDEHLWMPDIRAFLASTTATMIRPRVAYNMFTLNDETDYHAVTRGLPAEQYCKTLLFRPKEIKEMNYNHGCHTCTPEGNVLITTPKDCIIYHYNLIGIERTIKRYHERAERMSATNKENKWGWQYLDSDEQIRSLFDCYNETKEVRKW